MVVRQAFSCFSWRRSWSWAEGPRPECWVLLALDSYPPASRHRNIPTTPPSLLSLKSGVRLESAFHSLSSGPRCVVLGPVSGCEAKSRAKGRAWGCSYLVSGGLPSCLTGTWVSSRTGVHPAGLPGTFINLLLISHPLVGLLPHLKEKVGWTCVWCELGCPLVAFLSSSYSEPQAPPASPYGSKKQRPSSRACYTRPPGHQPMPSCSPFLSGGGPCAC